MNLRFNTALRTYLQEAHDALDMGKPADIPDHATGDTWAENDRLRRALRMGVAQAKISAAIKMLGKDKRNG